MVHHHGPASKHARAPAEGPVRTCVGCRNRALTGELLRIVISGGELAFDLRRSLPGRGAWLHPDLGCLSKAERRRAFAKSLRASGELDTGRLQSELEALVHRTTGTGSSRAGQEERKQVDPS
ncbi:YlxR family protein [Actinophytocola sp.]|uniref:YlxR family protein n=1 Tax=Actinophytocola sp. TaxID=1872138 RepID=UPI002D4BF558|nr:YlxR family protein [Actinophytocola sp.]HYQ63072.1 YlxR family protein [Actinophytocola sp.]